MARSQLFYSDRRQMDQYDLYSEIMQKRHELDACIMELRKNGTALAEAERAYKVRLAETSLQLRDEGMPVTLISQVVRGLQDVADLRFKRDASEVVYKADMEAIQSIKLQLRLIEAQLEREWSNPQAGF